MGKRRGDFNRPPKWGKKKRVQMHPPTKDSQKTPLIWRKLNFDEDVIILFEKFDTKSKQFSVKGIITRTTKST